MYNNEIHWFIALNGLTLYTVCLEVSCGFPPAYDDVQLIGDDFQGEVTLRCRDVETNVTTDLNISCQANGRWNLDSGFSCSLGTYVACDGFSCNIGSIH